MEASRVLRLYEIVDDMLAVEELLIESGGEITEEIAARLDRIEGEFSRKIETMAHLHQNLLRSADAYYAEADRLSAQAKTMRNGAASLKRYIHQEMERGGRDRLDTGTFKLRIQANSRPSIRWVRSMEALPERYAKIDVRLDGTQAYEDWKADGELPEGFHIEHGRHLRLT